MVVQGHVTHERLLQIFTAGESMGFKHISDTSVEALDHAVGARRAGLGQAKFNIQGLAQLIKLIVARGLALTAGKQPVGELLAVVGQDFLQSVRIFCILIGQALCNAFRNERAAAAVLWLLI
jgi:hypothetical protein